MTIQKFVDVEQLISDHEAAVDPHTGYILVDGTRSYTGGQTFANVTDAINSGAYALQFQSGVADGASAVGFDFDTTNALSTDGAKTVSFSTNGTEQAYIGYDNSDYGMWTNKLGVGSGAVIDEYAIFDLNGTMNITNAYPASGGKGAFNLDATMNMTGAIKQTAAFAGFATIEGTAVLPFVGGMLFQTTKNCNVAMGANAGRWGQAPTNISSRWVTTTADSTGLGNWAVGISSYTPYFEGGEATTYIGLEANEVKTTGYDSNRQPNNYSIVNTYGLYVWPQQGTTNGTGVYIDTCSHYGLVLDGDSSTDCVAWGESQAATAYYDGTDLIIDPKESGSGALDVKGTLKSDESRLLNKTRYTTTATMAATDDECFCNGTFTFTLATGVDRQRVRVVNSGTGTITVAPASGEDLLGTTDGTFTLQAGETRYLVYDSTDGWF